MFVKHYAPKAFFGLRCFVQLDKSVQNKLHKCMKKFISGNCSLNDLKWFWNIWPWWPWPLTPKSIGFLCYPGWMCGLSLRKVGQGILELQIETVLAHLTFDPEINRVHMLPRMDVLTKFEEGRSRRSRVIDRKRKGYRWTDRLTWWTDRHVQSNMPSLLRRRGIKI